MNDRFWAKIENGSGADCWQWLGYTSSNGYGHFGIKKNGKHATTVAHRVARELCCGPIPLGKCVLHHCDNRGCCNPSHLFLGDNDTNMADMVRKGRSGKGEKNGNAKLTWSDFPYIRLLAFVGESQHLLAKRYGVTHVAIGYVLSGKTWRESETELREIEEFLAAIL